MLSCLIQRPPRHQVRLQLPPAQPKGTGRSVPMFAGTQHIDDIPTLAFSIEGGHEFAIAPSMPGLAKRQLDRRRPRSNSSDPDIQTPNCEPFRQACLLLRLCPVRHAAPPQTALLRRPGLARIPLPPEITLHRCSRCRGDHRELHRFREIPVASRRPMTATPADHGQALHGDKNAVATAPPEIRREAKPREPGCQRPCPLLPTGVRERA